MRELCIAVVLMLCLASVDAREHSNVRRFSGLDTSASEIVNANSHAEGSPFYGRILRLDEFQMFERGLQLVEDDRCRLDLNATLWGVVNEEHWAVSMYDASAKGVYGIESGMVYQFGHYDQCIELNRNLEADLEPNPIRSKYCLADVTVDGITVKEIASRKYKPGNSTIVHWGTCVPASCGAKDVEIFLQNFLQKNVSVDEKLCQVETKLQITQDMLIYASIVMFFVALALASTLYHAYDIYVNRDETKKPRRGNLDIALKSISIIENLSKLGKSSKDHLGLHAINGIKAISMILIVGGHALSFFYSGPVYNSGFMAENVKKIQNAFLTNSLLFVDIFLFLSGFLFCRILLVELERRRGKVNALFIYIGRYVRLTPSYMAVIGFYMTWFPVVGNGPIWSRRIIQEQERCQQSWWLNVLYINNYIGTDKLCMFQSWYLSVDSQLFVLASIVIYLLYKSRKMGFHLLMALLAIAIVIPFTVTYVNKLDPTLMVYADEIEDFATNPFYVGSYIKTHMRAVDYVLGLLAGFVVHLMHERNTKIPKWLVKIIWIVSIVVGVGSMFSNTRFYTGSYTALESALYAVFHKVGWGLSIGWLVIAVCTGHAISLQKILSNRIFPPLSRLTYCAYLCNGMVELFYSSALRHPAHLTRLSMINELMIHTVATFGLALIVCLLFESPIHALERILFRLQKKPCQPKGSHTTPSTSEEQVA